MTRAEREKYFIDTSQDDVIEICEENIAAIDVDLLDLRKKIEKEYREKGASKAWRDALPNDIFIPIFAEKIAELEVERKKYASILFRVRNNGKVIKGYIDVEEIKKNVDIGSLLGRPIKEVGERVWFLCPLHDEATGSFCWYKKTNSFYCFGCGVGGDVITLYRKIEGCDFKDAIKKLSTGGIDN